MRIRSEGDIPRVDPTVLRRFVPALWAEWGALRFGADGHLLDADTGEPLTVLRLSEGLHRNAGARYTLVTEGAAEYTFTLADDDGRTVRGTLSGPPGSLRVALGHQVSASGRGTVEHCPGRPQGGPSAGDWTVDVATGDRWRADGHVDLAAPQWSAGLTLGQGWQLTARVDVRTLLLADEVPSYAVGLIGGAPATVELTIDPSALARRGDLVTGRAGMQRVAADGKLDVKATSDVWHCRLTLHLHGRGLLGRTALVAARPAVRRAAREGLTEFWSDLASQAASANKTLADLATGGPDERLHRELWDAVRAADRESTTSVATAAQPPTHAEPDRIDSGDPVGSGRRRSALLVGIAAVSVVLIALVVAVVLRASSSGGGGSPNPDLTSTPPLHVRHVAVTAFAGSDLGTGVSTAAITGSTRAVPDVAAHDLTGRSAGSIWNTSTTATAPDGSRYDVFVLAVDLDADPHHPGAAPAFSTVDTLGSSAGLGAGWRTTTELGPYSGPPWYPSAANLTGHTLLIIRLNVVSGAASELRRLTTQLTLPVRQQYLGQTRP